MNESILIIIESMYIAIQYLWIWRYINVVFYYYYLLLVQLILKRGYIEFKYYADAIHSGLTLPG